MTDPGKIRNIALVGHRGTGKTALFEALLYRGGVVNRLGKVEDGTTVSDYDDDEKRRQLSLQGTLAHVERGGLTLNLIDTPGDPSFQADTIAALRVVETALITVNSVLGVEVQTERLWGRAAEQGLARLFFCNMLDRERADLAATVAALRAAFGPQVVPVQLPIEPSTSSRGRRPPDDEGTRSTGRRSAVGDVPADLADAAAEARATLIGRSPRPATSCSRSSSPTRRSATPELKAAMTAAIAGGQLFPAAAGSGRLWASTCCSTFSARRRR
jgi:elongation factor G